MSQLPGNQFDPFAPSPPLIPEPPTGGPTMHSPQMAGYQGLNVAQQQQQQPQQYQQPTGYNMASRQQQQQQQLQQQQKQQQQKQQQQQQQALNSTAVFGGNANVAGGGQLVPVNSQQSQFAVYNVPQQQPNFTQQSFPSQMQYPHQQQQAYPGSFMAQPTQSMPSPQLQIPMQTQQLYPPPVSYQQQQQQQNQHQHQQYQMPSLSSSELEQPNHYQQRQTAPPRPSTDFEQMINRTKKPDDVSTDTVETSNTSKKPYETPTKQPSSTHLVSSSIPNPPISSTNAKFHQQAVSPLGSVASMATHKDNGPIIFQPQTDNQINSPSRNRNNSKDNNHNHNETDQYNENTVESREKEKEIHAVSRFLASQSDNFTELPNPDHVHSTGYILSRISLRTIFMKKWKQTYWMRYGPTGTVILFFRSKEDAEDWLHNPYHQKKERDFLIKLKIDFVKDLDKANVKGYRAAQISVKNYQNQVYHQFKLERWMDYGPAIACAFASQEGAEAVRLRNVILECMKSSPRDVYTRQCYEQAHAEAEYIQENRKPYDDSYAHQQTFSYDSVKEDSDNNVIPSDTTYFQYDADTLAIDQLQTQKADNNTVAKGRYNNYKI